MDLTVMHINKGNAHGTQGERSNPANSNEYLLLCKKNCYPTAISATSRCLAERRDPSVAVQNTYISLKGMETQDITPEIALLVC